MSDLEPADRELLAHVRAMFDETDPVPEFLLDAARATFSWRTIDAELAELTNDSLLEGAAVRAARVPRLLTFTSDVATLVVEVAEHVRGAGIGRRLLGQILSPRPAGTDQPGLPFRRCITTAARHQLGDHLIRRPRIAERTPVLAGVIFRVHVNC